MSPVPGDLVPGTIVGGYRIDHLLGRGGMGVVYAATHTVIDKRVAVKVIGEEAATFPRGVERFIQEARLVNRIGHPNIVDVFGFHELEGRPVLFMELLQGETLRRLLERRKRLNSADAVRLMLPVVEALGAAHAAGVVHRDLKPDNLFVVDPDRFIVKVLDFGIAKLLDTSPDSGRLSSATNTWMGTPEYMSPEQCTLGQIDGRSDLYAVGLILFEMLAGERPFTAARPGEYIVKHMHETPPRIETRAAVEPALAAIVMRLLEKEPAARPASASELEKELRFYLAQASAARTVAADPMAQTLNADGRAVSPAAPKVGPEIGRSILPSGAPSIEENRLCTVLFADVSGFTALSERLAPEETKEVIDGCFAVMSTVIEQQGGYIDKYIGDCVMAVFGIPRATDTDAERAVYAALQLQRAVARYSARNRKLASAKTKLSLRVGVNTGRVFAGTVGGRRELTVMGDAVNVASRLQSLAPDESVVIGRDTHRHVMGVFEVEDLPPLKAKGKSEPLVAFNVLGVTPPRARAGEDEFYGSPTKFVGRRGELNRILDIMEEAFTERSARIVRIVANPGAGKSRLANEARRATLARTERTQGFWARASFRCRDTPYELAADLLRGRCDVRIEDAREMVVTKLRAGLTRIDDGVEEAIELLSTILGGAAANTLTAVGESVGDARTRINGAFARYVESMAAGGPLAIFCDGLEGADDASLDLLDYLVVRLSEAPLLIVATTRPELADRRPAWGEGLAAHHEIRLEPFSRRAMEEMARDLLRRVDPLSTDLVRSLVDRAEGNPLFLRETLRVLADAGALDRSDNAHWRVREELLERVALPSTIHAIVQARLDRLEPGLRQVLQRAAVIGRTFREGLLKAILDGSHTSGGRPLRGALEDLRGNDLIRARERSSFPSEREYVFVDGVTQEVAYESLSVRTRERCHKAVATWLSVRGAAIEEGNPALLAFHFDRGASPRDAVSAYVRAGARAAQLSQNADAIRHYERACAIGEEAKGLGLPEGSGHDLNAYEELRVAEWTERVELRLALGDTLRRVGRLDDAALNYETARGDILRAERRAGRKDDATAVARLDGSIDLRLGLVDGMRGDWSHALERYSAAQKQLEQTGAAKLLASLYAALAFARFRTGAHDEALATCRAGLALCRSIPPNNPDRADASSRLLLNIGAVFYQRGELVRAERSYRQAGRVVNEQKFPVLVASALNNVAAVCFRRSELPIARDLFARTLGIFERVGDLYHVAIACNNLAEVDLTLGQVEPALGQVRRAIQLFEGLRALDLLPDAYRNLGESLLAHGDTVGALDAATRATELACEPQGAAYLTATAPLLSRCLDIVSVRWREFSTDAQSTAASAVERIRARPLSRIRAANAELADALDISLAKVEALRGFG